MRRPKLFLNKSEHFKDLKAVSIVALKQLRADGPIKANDDIITDLSVCFLQHTKDILERDFGYVADSKGYRIGFL